MAYISPSSLHRNLSLCLPPPTSFNILTPSKHTHQLLCLFSSAVAISPSVIDIILGVRSSLFCVNYFGGGQWERWVASLSVSVSLRWSCCHNAEQRWWSQQPEDESFRDHGNWQAVPLLNVSDIIEICFFFRRVQRRTHLPMHFSAATTFPIFSFSLRWKCAILCLDTFFFYVVRQPGSCPAHPILQFIKAKLLSYAPI